MKRFLAIVAISVFVAILMNACKGGEHCPAYGQSGDQQTEQNS
jgi:hypothetical protein